MLPPGVLNNENNVKDSMPVLDSVGCDCLVLVMQEELIFHIRQSEAKDLKAVLRSTLQQQAGISASSKRAGKHT